MSEEIRKLYEKLYNENKEELEEQKENVKEEIKSNKEQNNESRTNRRVLRIVIEIVLFIIIYIMLTNIYSKTIGNNRSNGNSVATCNNVFIAIFMVIGCIGAVYEYIIKPKRTVEQNYNLKNDKEDKEKYNKIFCTKICKPVIEYAILGSSIDIDNGVERKDYESMGFSIAHDRFTSSYGISLKDKDNLKMSKVFTDFKEESTQGYSYVTMFSGLVSINTLLYDTNTTIMVRNKKLPSRKLKNAIPTDNEEFNRFYEVEAGDKELFAKYFTDDVANYFIDLAKNGQRLEVNIINNHIYTRLPDNDFLEFNIQNDDNVEKIINDCNSIIAVINTNEFLEKKLK